MTKAQTSPCRDDAPEPEPVPADTGCDAIPRERPRYFLGRLLTARDLSSEQDYLLGRARLRNRLFRGSGVVCGFEVAPHPRPECRDGWVVVAPGIAIDAHGREILACSRQAVPLPEPVPEPPEPGQCDDDEEAPAWGPFVVCLRYAERLIEPQPVLVAGDGCRPGTSTPARVQEAHLLEVRRRDALPPECWGAGQADEAYGCDAPEADDRVEGKPTDCFAPVSPCGDCLPIALLRLDDRGQLVIETGGVPRIAGVPGAHARIVGTSWRHGGTVALADFRAEGRRISVRFSRRLLAGGTPPGTGIGAETFRVTYRHAGSRRERLILGGDPALDADGRSASFTVPDRYCDRGDESIRDAQITVTLRCDFILDARGDPVDGTHLRGALPTGNGTAGGDFVSWFTIVDGTTQEAAR
jgi:hypothetical protein